MQNENEWGEWCRTEKARMGKRERKGTALHCCCVVLVTWGGGTVWDYDTLLVT